MAQPDPAQMSNGAMNRAYSVLEIKAVNEDERVIEGVATTPTTDRMGDIVESKGAKFKNPLPLLWQHMSSQPVGQARFSKATDEGIEFSARLPKINEAGALKERVDEAWQSVKHGLVRGVSIGFRTLQDGVELLEDGGIHFLKTEILELSLVTIPANQEATITNIRSIDADLRAASGRDETGDDTGEPASAEPPRPGASGKSVKIPKRKERDMKTFSEQISDLEAARAAKSARMAEIMEKSAEEGRSTDDAEREEFDDLEREVEAIDGDLKRFRSLEKTAAANAKPVDSAAVKTVEGGSAARGGHPVRVTSPKALPGIRFARVAKCLGMARGHLMGAREIAKQLYGDDQGIMDIMDASVRVGSITRAAVPGASVDDSQWAGALVGDETSVFADFAEFLRPQTIVGRFGTDGIPSLRRVPFRVALISQESGGSGAWVGEGRAKPLTKADFKRRTLEPLKVANIAVATDETLRDSSPSAEMLIRDTLAGALRDRLNFDFIDPSVTETTGVRPASITNGISEITSTGNTADDVREDVRLILNQFVSANNPPTTGVWIMSAQTALALSILVNTLGQREFGEIGMGGGRFFGLPVITSEHVTSTTGSPAGGIVVLVNAGDIYFADEGGIAIDMSRETSLEMDDSPAADISTGSPSGVTPPTTNMVSMFQVNAVAFRAERTLSWMRRRDSGVALLSGVNWGEA